MKNIILTILFFLGSKLYAQKDTIVINQKDIKIRQEQVYNFKKTLGGYSLIKEYYLKETNELLHGFYKIFIDENYFYTSYFENGLQSLSKEPYNNVVKYYKNNNVYKLEVFYPYFVTTLYYYSVENFDCKAKNLVGYKKNIFDNTIESTFKIKQKVTKDTLKWVFKGNVRGKIHFSKIGVCK